MESKRKGTNRLNTAQIEARKVVKDEPPNRAAELLGEATLLTCERHESML
jgi:hypothetical protein